MVNLQFDKNGVPICSPQYLENKAEEVLCFFDKSVVEMPQATPLREISERLEKDFKIKIDFNAELGLKTEGEHKVVGKFIFKPRAILIDCSLQEDTEVFNFTLAHEIGHLVLHRNLKIEKSDSNEISDTKIDLVTGKKNFTTARDWIEWQANRFAECLLMPCETVRSLVVEKQKEMGIERNIGLIYLDDQVCNIKAYLTIRECLQNVYQVSKSVVEYRLSNLTILIDKRGINISHISELLRRE